MNIILFLLIFIAITNIFITCLFLFNDHLILIIQKAYAQYHLSSSNNNTTSINDKTINFTKSFNLTNNTQDSVYPRVAAFGNNVYVIWQESVSPNSSSTSTSTSSAAIKDETNNISSSNSFINQPNYDIFIKKSSDGGVTFNKEINLSNNSGFSEHPHLSVYGNNVYTIWLDNDTSTNYNKEIFFRKSNDGGKTFSNIIHLDDNNNSSNIKNKSENNIGNSINEEISAFKNNVYVIWVKENQSQYLNHNGNNNNKILFRASVDGGSTFKNIKTLSNNASSLTYPKITTLSTTNNNDDGNVYIIWNIGLPDKSLYRNGDGIFFTKSNDYGNNFNDAIRINGPIKSIGKAQLISYKNNIHIVWSGIPDFRIGNNIFYTKSDNNGNSFTNPVSLDSNKSLAVEVTANKDNLYILWEKIVSGSNDDIFIKTSNNEGQYFTKDAINLSNNHGISECPSIALLDNNKAFIAWEDSTPGNHDIFFKRL